MRRALVGAVLLAALMGNRMSAAQDLYRPYVLPTTSVADPDSPHAFVVNPAAHALGGTFELIHSDGPSSVPISGEGLYLASPSLGFATEWGRSPGDIDHVLFTFGQRIPVGRTFALGVNYGFSPRGVGDYRYDTWSVGALWTPSPYAAVGISGHHLNHPRGDGPGGNFALEPRLQTGVAIRPTGRDNVTLTADLVKYEGDEDPTGLLGLRLELLPGLQIYGASDLEGHITTGLTLRQVHNSYRAYAVEPAGSTRPGYAFAIDASKARQDTFLRSRPALARIEIDGDYPDIAPTSLFGRPGEGSLPHLLFNLDRLRNDPTVDGVIVELSAFGGGLAKAREVRAALEALERDGKNVYCYADDISTSLYVIGTGCEMLVMSPGGTLFLTGLSATYQFLGGSLEKIGVEFEFARRGKYKSSPETIAFTEPTEPFVQQMNELLDSEFETLITTIARGRGIDSTHVRELIDKGAFLPKEAKEAGLIDDVGYADEMKDLIEKRASVTPHVIDDWQDNRHRTDRWGTPPRIAIIYVSGAIVDGSSRSTPLTGTGLSGSDTIRKALNRARKDPTVKAAVLRIDSPGGSSLASDLIWRDVVRLAEEKPVVVSMGGVAASGGYYIAAPGTEIFADDATVTGSIGVYILRPNFAGLYEKIGLNTMTFKRGEYATLFDTSAPLSDQEEETIDRLVEAFYQDFLSRVSEGRDKPVEDVDQVAQGRVWTGRQAKDVGLVDKLGGLADAIKRARELAEIPDGRPVTLLELPRTPNLFKQLREGVPESAPLAGTAESPASSVLTSMEVWSALGTRPASLLPFRFNYTD